MGTSYPLPPPFQLNPILTSQVVGHTYIIYAPLLNGSTTVLYEGKPVGTPNAGIFWKLCNEYNVKALFTAPTALRAIKREDDEGKYLKTGGLESGDKGLKNLQAVFLAGERSEPTIVTFYQGTQKLLILLNDLDADL